MREALFDFIEAIRKYQVWFYLGRMDVKQRYKRSVLGPWWISLSMLIFVSSMSIVFSRLFQQSTKDYVPFFTAGFLVWQMVSATLNESVDLFRSHSGFIKQIKLPCNLYLLKHLTRQLLIFLHNFVVYVLVALYFQVEWTLSSFLVFPAVLLVLLNLYWISTVMAFFGARFRDIAPIMQNCIQIAFFITPISWMPKLLSANSLIVKLNPFAYFIEIIRNPLLGLPSSMEVWMVTASIAVIGLVFSGWILSLCQHRISFWVD